MTREFGMAGSGNGGAFKGLQESAMEIYRSIVTPALRRCQSFRSMNARNAASMQQSENLKWQQDMFLRLVNMVGLCREGLVSNADVCGFRMRILDNVTACCCGEFEIVEVTRDKLLFIQELLYVRCISEDEYHTVKRTLLMRLAEKGAIIDSCDIVLQCTSSAALPKSAPISPLRESPSGKITYDYRLKHEKIADAARAHNKSPVKQLIEAVSHRLKKEDKASAAAARAKVPHALDFLRPKDCPTRDAPSAPLPPPQFDLSDQCGSPLFYSPTGSATSMESSSKAPKRATSFTKDEEYSTPAARNLFPSPPQHQQQHKSPLSGHKSPLSATKSANHHPPSTKVSSLINDIMRRLHTADDETPTQQQQQQQQEQEQEQQLPQPQPQPQQQQKKAWRLDLLRPPKIVTPREDVANVIVGGESEAVMTTKEGSGSNEKAVLSPSNKNRVPKITADTVKLKKKLHNRGASTDFFIDKVLGENIKKELDRIRSEMSKKNPTQSFTNDQIDAIATRLPADKAELMRFFPKSWCDRYGDIVLDVVHKEFKGHVNEMESARKNAREKRRTKQAENDENNNSGSNSNPEPTISKATSSMKQQQQHQSVTTRCFTTMDNSSNNSNINLQRRRKVSCVDDYEELDGKLHAEIQKMPHMRRVVVTPVPESSSSSTLQPPPLRA